MNPLQAALREKYGTPEKALAALGLPATLLAADAGDGPLLTALKRNSKMAKLSSTALRAHSALTAFVLPRLAADAAMPDLTSAVAGITRANLGKQKQAIWARTKVLLKPVLGNDQAGPDDVAMRILEMIDQQGAAGGEVAGAEGMGEPTAAEADQTVDEAPVTEPNAAVPTAAVVPPKKKPGEEEEAQDAPDPAIMKALAGKLGGDAEMAKACYDICMGGATDEVVDPARTEKPATEAAVDEEAPMMKPAMDAAIKGAVAQAKADMRAEARAAAEARQVVRPWVGEVSIAFDTADSILEHSLKSLGISVKGVHPSAFRTILENLPKPGSSVGGRKQRELAMDEAPGKDRGSDLAKRFPHAGRIQVLG
jgi:hypothetical protein